ncbi:MAG: Fe-S cluster assembly protein SufB, partial [Hyphomonas sp.]
MDNYGGTTEHEDECMEVIVKDSIDAGTIAAAKALESENYSAGFTTDIEMDMAPKGLSEDT